MTAEEIKAMEAAYKSASEGTCVPSLAIISTPFGVVELTRAGMYIDGQQATGAQFVRVQNWMQEQKGRCTRLK